MGEHRGLPTDQPAQNAGPAFSRLDGAEEAQVDGVRYLKAFQLFHSIKLSGVRIREQCFRYVHFEQIISGATGYQNHQFGIINQKSFFQGRFQEIGFLGRINFETLQNYGILQFKISIYCTSDLQREQYQKLYLLMFIKQSDTFFSSDQISSIINPDSAFTEQTNYYYSYFPNLYSFNITSIKQKFKIETLSDNSISIFKSAFDATEPIINYMSSNHVIQGRSVRNPYMNMDEQPSDYPVIGKPLQNPYESQVPTTYEMHANLPMGRPIPQRQYHPEPTFNPPQPMHHQPMMMHQPVMMQPPTTLNFANNRKAPTNIICHNCKANVTTVVKHQAGGATYVWACILGKTTGLCCIPFCVESCQDKVHFCPKCGVEAGKTKAKICCD